MIYVMSDIHGCLNRYRNVLRQIRLRKDDHLYILGDVIDRGPEGLRILRDTMERGNVTLLLGNHEHMMLEALRHPGNDELLELWYANGGRVTHEHFKHCNLAYRAKVLAYIRNLPLNLQVSANGTDYLLVHGAPASTLIRGIANATLEDMATQPLLIPRRDVFGVELPDYAMPGFCSGSKLYFGSIEDIASFRRALYSDDRCKPEDMEFMSAKLYGAKYSSQAAGKCEHTNVWGFPYFAWWDKLESVHLWIRYKDRFLRCVRVRMTYLRIDTNEDASGSYSPGEQLWGYPHILEYRQPYHFNRMYEVEKTYETEDSLLYDLAHYDGSIELTTWLDDLFGDG